MACKQTANEQQSQQVVCSCVRSSINQRLHLFIRGLAWRTANSLQQVVCSHTTKAASRLQPYVTVCAAASTSTLQLFVCWLAWRTANSLQQVVCSHTTKAASRLQPYVTVCAAAATSTFSCLYVGLLVYRHKPAGGMISTGMSSQQEVVKLTMWHCDVLGKQRAA
jgi:hypothetical protein